MDLANRISQHESYAETIFNRCASGYDSYFEIEDHREEIRKCLEEQSDKTHPFSITCENIGVFTSPEISEIMMTRNRVIFSDQSIMVIDIGDPNRLLVSKKIFRDLQDKKVNLEFKFM